MDAKYLWMLNRAMGDLIHAEEYLKDARYCTLNANAIQSLDDCQRSIKQAYVLMSRIQTGNVPREAQVQFRNVPNAAQGAIPGHSMIIDLCMPIGNLKISCVEGYCLWDSESGDHDEMNPLIPTMCGHKFHKLRMMRWMAMNEACPCCSVKFHPRDYENFGMRRIEPGPSGKRSCDSPECSSKRPKFETHGRLCECPACCLRRSMPPAACGCSRSPAATVRPCPIRPNPRAAELAYSPSSPISISSDDDSSTGVDGKGHCTLCTGLTYAGRNDLQLRTSCGHQFHEGCLKKWMEEEHSACPECQTQFKVEDFKTFGIKPPQKGS